MTSAVVKRDPIRRGSKSWQNAQQWKKWETVGLAPTLNLDDFILNWTDARAIDLQARGAITGIDLERTIEGASTLTVKLRDPRGHLFSTWAGRMRQKTTTRRQRAEPVAADEERDVLVAPDLIGKAMEVHLDGLVFRLVAIAYQHQTEELVLTFEDRIVYLLRRKRGERRASRAKTTRAQFILSLLREIKLTRPPFVCPDLSARQPIDKPSTPASSRRVMPRRSTIALRRWNDLDQRNVRTSPPGEASGAGIATGAKVTVKGKTATPQQKRTGQLVLDTAAEKGADNRATIALVAACIIESGMANLRGGDRDSRGILQIRDTTGRPMGIDNRDVVESVTAFLERGFWGKGGAIDLARKNPNRSVGWVAQQTQGSAYPDRYDQVADEAKAWLDAYGGAVFEPNFGTYVKSYQYARAADENSWQAIQRLAEEVAWRFFVVGEAVYYIDEQALYTRRPRHAITAESELLIDLSYDVDWGKPASEISMVVALDRWAAPPGSTITLDGFGPPDGRWLVSTIRRDWFSPTAEVTLKQPAKARMEPAAERVERKNTAEGGVVGAIADPTASGRVYNEALAISQRKLAYIWGGGHAHIGTADEGAKTTARDSGKPPGFDCSGYVCACLAAGGLGMRPGQVALTSGGLMRWGEAGPGERVTVWANPTHTFIEFGGLGAGQFADTGRNAAPPADRGPRLRTGRRSTDGFTARHWPGT